MEDVRAVAPHESRRALQCGAGGADGEGCGCYTCGSVSVGLGTGYSRKAEKRRGFLQGFPESFD